MKHSEINNKVRLILYLGDSDCKAFNCVDEIKPYGEHVSISIT